MPQIFNRTINAISRLTLFGGIFAVAVVTWGWAEVITSRYFTEEKIPVEQPVPFSHRHHVSGLGIDCRYCHTSVEIARTAGLPATETCMTCHSQIWTNAAMLAPVRQ